MKKSARVLGIAGHHTLGHPDGELEDGSELREQMVRYVRRAATRKWSSALTRPRSYSERTT